jgi:apolipoprotein N-acyltransferase
LSVESWKLNVLLYRWFLPVTAGVLTALAFPPFNMGQLAWLSLVPLIFAVENCDRGEAFRRGYIAGLAFFGMTVWWVVHVTVPGAVALIASLALYFGAASVVFAIVSARIAKTNAATPEVGADSVVRNLGAAVVASTSWVTLEWVRGWFLLGGFPWNDLGVSQWQAVPFIQFANVTGVYGVSALLCFVNFAFYFTIRRLIRQIGKDAPMRRLSWEFYAGMALVCLAFAHGLREIRSGAGQPSRTLRLGLVQADIPQTLKFDPNQKQMILSRHRELTEALLADRPELIIWPETATPWVIQNDRESVDLVTNILARSDAYLLTGFFDDRRPRMYNAAILFTPQRAIAGIYRKLHLVPFGEYIPLRAIWSPLLKRIGPKDYDVDDFFDLSPGDEYTVFEANGFRFGTVICFEDTVADLYCRFVQRDVDFMVNLTNDAWFKTSPESEMHLANAVFRAVENRRPLVRATNNGVTCAVSEHGFIRARCAPFTQASLSYELRLPADHTQTFYTRHGDVFVVACAVVSLVAIGLAAFRRNRLQSPA